MMLTALKFCLHLSVVLPHPGSRDSFCFPEQGREKEAQPESRQSFGVTATQTCGLVNLALSRQSFFLCVQASVYCKFSKSLSFPGDVFFPSTFEGVGGGGTYLI